MYAWKYSWIYGLLLWILIIDWMMEWYVLFQLIYFIAQIKTLAFETSNHCPCLFSVIYFTIKYSTSLTVTFWCQKWDLAKKLLNPWIRNSHLSKFSFMVKTRSGTGMSESEEDKLPPSPHGELDRPGHINGRQNQ